MIDHDTLGKLRLGAFLPGRELASLENWEFLDRLWVGEGFGFTSFLRLEDEPEVVRAVELDLATLTPAEAARIFKAVGLPLERGLTLADLPGRLGEPISSKQFVADRDSYRFHIPSPRYNVNCTVLNDGGLIYVVVDNL